MSERVKKEDWSNKNLIISLKNALRGVIHILNHHYNARLIFLFAVFAVSLGCYLNISRLELFVLGVAIIIVFIAEVINTIVEDTLDLITSEFHPKIKIIKDVAAGVVLVAVFFALFVGWFVFTNRILKLFR